MNKYPIYMLALCFSLIFLISCKKEEKHDISGKWKILSTEGTTEGQSPEVWYPNVQYQFNNDGTAISTQDGYTFTLEWYFTKDRKKINIVYLHNGSTGLFDVVFNHENEMTWVQTLNFGAVKNITILSRIE